MYGITTCTSCNRQVYEGTRTMGKLSYIRIRDRIGKRGGYLGSADDNHCVTSIRDARVFTSKVAAKSKLDDLMDDPHHFLGAGSFSAHVFTREIGA